MIDSGADFNIFHGDVAAYLGLKLTAGSRRNIAGISRGKIKGYEHRVKLLVNSFSYQTKITFSNELPSNAIAVLGNSGFFDKFRVLLDLKNRTIDLRPQ
ncbi:MAG: hypothetical protein U1C50_00240 [Patescibacteria group bacterium]|nr:hypothetical protein [Patescibacteria group bacterium]